MGLIWSSMPNRTVNEKWAIRSALPDDLDRTELADGIADIYCDAFGGPPYHEPESAATDFVDRLRNEAERQAWRLLVAEEDGAPRGFVYGYASRPGQWWHDAVTAELPEQLTQHWFTNAFVIVEFAVHTAAQGRSMGTRLLEGILRELPHTTALAMTHWEENPAVGFYRNRGWRILKDDFRFNEKDKRRAILGTELARHRVPSRD